MANSLLRPNATEVPPQFPQQYVPVQSPTAAFLHSSIPQEVKFNLYRVISEGVRHEESTYGYFNSAFSHIFPSSQRFQASSLTEYFELQAADRLR